MAIKPVQPNTHPSWLQQYMHANRAEIHSAVEAAKAETDPNRSLEHVRELAEQVEYLNSVVLALVNHVVRHR